MSRGSKFWCGTLNNYDHGNYDDICVSFAAACNYCVIGREVGETGTPHLQAYFEFKSRKRLSTLKREFGDGWHWERRRGTNKEASDYCKKDGDFWEHGELKVSQQGRRTDIERVRDMIDEGHVTNEIDLLNSVGSMQGLQYGKAYLATKFISPFRFGVKCYWFHGGSGVGKSRAAFEFCRSMYERAKWNYWRSPGGIKWFDGYVGQEIAIFDDFRFSGTNLEFAYLLQLFDVYRMRVPVKGSFSDWNPRIIIVTAPNSPTNMFSTVSETEQLNQFVRRFGENGILDFDVNGLATWNSLIIHYLEGDEEEDDVDSDADTVLYDPPPEAL